jgi:hypothetical protein
MHPDKTDLGRRRPRNEWKDPSATKRKELATTQMVPSDSALKNTVLNKTMPLPSVTPDSN